jgi:hypothetical protein
LSLPNKMRLAQNDYFVVQAIYSGWAWLGIVLIAAILANAALAIASRGTPAFAFVLASTLCLLATLAIFFAVTFPANVATQNWTQIPADWQQLRWRWEVSHAVNAVITFIGFCALTASLLVPARQP